jgi:leader peptidase (prepilin peptidase)/N-methyltransferase
MFNAILSLPEPWFLVIVFILGASVGSFLNVVIYRLPKKLYAEFKAECDENAELPRNGWFGLEYLITPSSTCPSCGHKIRAWENLPIVGWFLLGGKCSGCKTPISKRYPTVEFLTALISVFVAHRFGVSELTAWTLLFTWILIALTAIDLDEQLLPDQLTLPLLWLGLLFQMSAGHLELSDSILGVIFGYGILWFIYHMFKMITGKEGMGYGDFKLLGALGAWLGWQMIPLVLIFSSVTGAIFGILLAVIAKRDRQAPMPFGPFLAAGGFIGMFWGDMLFAKYLIWIGIH